MVVCMLPLIHTQPHIPSPFQARRRKLFTSLITICQDLSIYLEIKKKIFRTIRIDLCVHSIPAYYRQLLTNLQQHRPPLSNPINNMASNASTHPLATVLTPDLFYAVLKDRMPFDHTQPVDFSGVLARMGGDFGDDVKEPAWTALRAISKIPLSKMPDMMQFLPAPSDAEFPKQFLGLLLIMDQGPRQLFSGVDDRWTSFFDEVVAKLAFQGYSLPEDQRPISFARWKAAGTHFDYWVLVHFWLTAHFVHSESMEYHELALKLTEEKRKAVEARVNETDPNRAKREDILSDSTGFPRVAMGGPPQGDKVTMQEWAFWAGLLLDTHYPIVKEFGRYPYRNAIQGRENTEEEKAWIEKTNGFGVKDDESTAKVREDIKNNRWTPLGVSA